MNSKGFILGKFGETAKNYIRESTAWINIAYGSVRSGKTIATNFIWIGYVLTSPHNEFLITGKTYEALKRNVIRPLTQLLTTFGIPFDFKTGSNELYINGKVCFLLGLNDEKAQDIIAGMTVGGWYADEIARYPKSAVDMAVSRCSLDGAKMFWTTNPDSPYHYLYTKYITNKSLIEKGTVKYWHFILEDNPNLSEEYVENLKLVNSKSEVFYKRNILGEWVIAEGAIYDKFLESENTFNNKVEVDTINLCCDYGVSTVTTFGVMGIKYDEKEGNTYYLIDETYYDAEVEGIKQSDSERVEDVVMLQDKYNLNENNVCFLPHDAGSLKAALEKDERIKMQVETYTPNTYEDIMVVADLINRRKFKIHTRCKNSIVQAQTYCWDDKAKQRGEDKPLKVNDHCPDMWRGGILGHRELSTTMLGAVFL